MNSGLIDLDELVLKCRNENAEKNIAEAVACYKAGAYRQAIVATWIAVVYDFISKLQELELSGDKNATIRIAEFEKIRKNNDLNSSLTFEKSIIKMAKDEFELISDIEAIDLTRLMEDRNRCAHPSMQTSDEIYTPSAELARTHIRNAVLYMLQHAPVQGKAALDRLLSEINSEYFPTNISQAKQYLQNGPLARPRESLVRNLIIALIKSSLIETISDKKRSQFCVAINAVRELFPDLSKQTLQEKLSEIFLRIEDSFLPLCITFLGNVPDIWQFLKDDVKLKLSNYVANMPNRDVDEDFLAVTLDLPPLREQGLRRLNQVDAKTLAAIIFIDPRPEYIDRGISLYETSKYFAYAVSISKDLIIPNVNSMNPEQVERIIRAIRENDQLRTYNRQTIFQSIRQSGVVSEENYFELLRKYGFSPRGGELIEKEATSDGKGQGEDASPPS